MRVIIAGLAVAVIAAVLLLIAGPGYRLDLWHYSSGFTLMKYAAYGGIAAAALSIVGLVMTRAAPGQALVMGILGLALGLGAAGIPWWWLQKARTVPPIHDITTDTENPPEFEAVLSLRADAPNPADYGGSEIAEQQLSFYTDVKPLILSAPPDAVFEPALAMAKDMGWEIVAADEGEGRIEATATTGWFGFKDDVVVRLTPVEGGTRVDARSVSRVGRSDVGTNARRIIEYLRGLERSAG